MGEFRVLVINGPNINMLGMREPDIYGRETYGDLVGMIESHCAALGVGVDIKQSNHEGALVDIIQAARGNYEGIVINPAAYTHTSVALLDALLSAGIKTVEVHISDTSKREDFRRISYVRSACANTIQGKGLQGYLLAIDWLLENSKAD